MSMNTETLDSNPIWAAIGKVGAFVTLIIALLSLYAQLNPDKANVYATCQVLDVLIRPKEPQTSAFSAAVTPVSPKELGGRTATGAPTKPGAVDTSSTKTREATEILEEMQLRAPQLALQCEIANKGRQEAKDIVIDIPVGAKAARANGKLLLHPDLSEKSIALGTLRPNGKLALIVWFESYAIYVAQREESYSLSFSGGVGSVQLSHPTYGWIASVAGFLEFLAKNPFYLLILITPLAINVLPVIGKLFVRKTQPTISEEIALNQDKRNLSPSGQNEIVQVVIPRSNGATPESEAKSNWRD